VPRRNRPAATRPTTFPRCDLEHFARHHLEAHADRHETSLPDELAMTVSEHPRTGTRFVSAGDCFDRLALRLADRARTDPSDSSGNLG